MSHYNYGDNWGHLNNHGLKHRAKKADAFSKNNILSKQKNYISSYEHLFQLLVRAFQFDIYLSEISSFCLMLSTKVCVKNIVVESVRKSIAADDYELFSRCKHTGIE